MYYQAGEYERSIEAAQEALKLRPNYDLAYNNICAAYNELEQWDRAIEAGEKAVKINPNSQIARNNLAWAKQQNMLLQKEQK
jgi:tetratricopeptide (TPR) repeat protein